MQRLLKWPYNKVVGATRRLGLNTLARSDYTNVYHCCVQKTASQWFKNVLSDPVVYRYTGLRVKAYPQIALAGHTDLADAVPRRVVAAHLYADHATYAAIPKPARFRTFFVTRDPRDIVVSFYFSSKYSHPDLAYISEVRRCLEGLDDAAGMRFCTDFLSGLGLFDAQRSWAEAADEDVRIFRYETLATDEAGLLRDLFDYLGIDMPGILREQLLARHTFSVKAGGRHQGEEDQHSHYRKGAVGDWRDAFDEATRTHFDRVTGDLVAVLGYASTEAG
jgi:hypothetical protein